MCEYETICWRRIYSKDLLERAEKNFPPTRLQLLIDHKIPPSIYPKGGIYAEHFPYLDSDGQYLNICPDLLGLQVEDCPEYKKEKRRQEHKVKYLSRFNRVYIPKTVRQAVAKANKYTCAYCGRHINSLLENGERLKGVIDHIVPLAKGGTNDIENLTLACRECNSRKSDEIWDRPHVVNDPL